MAQRPSESVLAWLRKLMSDRNTSVAALAEKVGIPRPRLRKVLSGAEPMLVDDLVLVSRGLAITPAEMGLPATAGDLPEEDPTPPPPPAPSAVDPWGNQPAQLVKIAFDLGCNVQFGLETDQLADSGIPAHVLKANAGRPLHVHLDAAYHAHMEPRFGDEALRILLGFDALYECTLPWSAFREVTFWPAALERAEQRPRPAEVTPPIGVPAPAETPTDEAPAPSTRERPRLRLVQSEDEEP